MPRAPTVADDVVWLAATARVERLLRIQRIRRLAATAASKAAPAVRQAARDAGLPSDDPTWFTSLVPRATLPVRSPPTPVLKPTRRTSSRSSDSPRSWIRLCPRIRTDSARTIRLFDDPMYLLSLEPGQTLRDHRGSAWIAGCEHGRREFVDACETAGFTPHVAYTSDDIIVEQALVAAGMGVTTVPGLALQTHRAPGIQASELPDYRRRVYVATYGDPPDPPATTAFVSAPQHAVEQTIPGMPAPPASADLVPKGHQKATDR